MFLPSSKKWLHYTVTNSYISVSFSSHNTIILRKINFFASFQAGAPIQIVMQLVAFLILMYAFVTLNNMSDSL